jgi:2-keto-4-pentenoate hydratase
MKQNYDQTVSIELDKGSAILGRPAAEAIWLKPAQAGNII